MHAWERGGFTLLNGRSEGNDLPAADLLLTDPPWKYGLAKQAKGLEYESMETDAIVRLLMALDWAWGAVWVTAPMLGEFVRAMPMAPVSVGAWDKGGAKWRGGANAIWNSRAEYLLLYRRKPGAFVSNQLIDNAVAARTDEHSFKPVSWQAGIVRLLTPPSGTIIDPFLGLGSSALAVLEAGGPRRFVGREVDLDRYTRAVRRLSTNMDQKEASNAG